MRLIWILLIACAVTFSGCSDNGDPIFTMDLSGDLVIPPGLNTFDTHYFFIRDEPTRLENYLVNYSQDDVSHIYSNAAKLALRFEDDFDWGIVREISVHLVSATDPSISNEVFFNDRINFTGVNELQLFGSLSDVRDILLQDRVTIEIRINFRRVTPFEIDSRLTMNFLAYGPE